MQIVVVAQDQSTNFDKNVTPKPTTQVLLFFLSYYYITWTSHFIGLLNGTVFTANSLAVSEIYATLMNAVKTFYLFLHSFKISISNNMIFFVILHIYL